MPDPIYIHAASRTISYGYEPRDYGRDDMRQPLSHLLAIPAKDILERVPVEIDSIFVSNQVADKSTPQELIVNQLVDSLTLADHTGKQYRLAGVSCLRIETATNGLAALKVALDHIQSGSAENVLVIGGEKLTPADFADDEKREAQFGDWAGQMIEYIASALAPDDKKYLRCMPAAMGIILNYYARTHSLDYGDLRRLIQSLSLRTYEDVLANKYGLRRYHRILKNETRSFYDDKKKNPLIVYPLRQLDMSPFNDGAGALLLSRHRELRMKNRGPSISDVAISGCALAQDTLALAERDRLESFPATALAAKRAYTEAGLDISDWQDSLAPLILEHHDAFVPLTLMNLEDLQLFADHRQVIDFLEGTHLANNESPLWLNPSGGLLEGHPFAGTAIVKLVECFMRLSNASENRIPQYRFRGKLATTAIVQSFGGIGANVGVAVLDKCDEHGEVIRERKLTNYRNLASRRTEERRTPSQGPRDGKIISIARVAMPYIQFDPEFKEHFGTNDSEPIETVLALVETQQGRCYSFAPRNSDEAKLQPEDICKRDYFVQLHEKNGYLSFSIDRVTDKSSFLLRKVA